MTDNKVAPQASAATLTNDQLKQRIAELEGQLQSRGNSRLSLKIGEKGGVSVYGLGRFPVSLYAAQWERLIAFMPDITAFIAANKAHLAVKAPKAATLAAVKAAMLATVPAATPAIVSAAK